MNVFILCTGRCGSTTFERACSHITNFTTAHESRANKIGEERVNYPKNHIESDNRLIWFLGRLDKKYKNEEVFYVHLKRDDGEVAVSYSKRFGKGLIMPAYSDGIILNGPVPEGVWKEVYARDFVENTNLNIELFLEDKPNAMEIQLDNFEEDFTKFWEAIGAEGNLDEALAELKVSYNFSGSGGDLGIKDKPVLVRAFAKITRFIKLLPSTFKIA